MRPMYFDAESRAIADLVELSQNRYLITRINVPREHRGRGLGTKLLGEILEEADSEGATLEIHPSPSGGLTMKQLVSWYGRYSFRPQGPLGVLVRRPQGGIQ